MNLQHTKLCCELLQNHTVLGNYPYSQINYVEFDIDARSLAQTNRHRELLNDKSKTIVTSYMWRISENEWEAVVAYLKFTRKGNGMFMSQKTVTLRSTIEMKKIK